MDNMDKICNYFKELLSEELGNKIQLARIYGAYEREEEETKKNNQMLSALGVHKSCVLHKISDDITIIEYPEDFFKDGNKWYKSAYKDRILPWMHDSFDIALIAAIVYKYNEKNAFDYIVKMLGMEE